MARSLDGVIRHLLDQIALCGDYGASPSDFITKVKDYYGPQAKDGDTAAESDVVSERPTTIPTVNRPFLEQIWNWLIAHPDITLGDHAGHKKLTMSEVEARNASVRHSKNSDSDDIATNEIGIEITNEDPQTFNDHEAVTAQNQEPNAFDKTVENVKCNTAQVTESGSQIEPVQISDTADHEHPSQTPQKSRKTGAQQKVGFSTTKKSATRPALAEDSTPSHGIRLYASQNRMWLAITKHGPDLTKVKSLDFGALSIIAANGPKGMYQHDLVRLSGQDKRSVPARTDRLDVDGYIEKRRVTIQLYKPTRVLNTSHLVLKRFVDEGINEENEAENIDENMPRSVIRKRKEALRRARQLRASQTASKPPAQAADNENEHLTSQPVPQWTPDQSLSNQIFDLIDQSGTEGMTMTGIRLALFGEYIRKPIDEYVSRLVECWQLSQPLHLRHLSIIRDTTLRGKTNIYIYYTFENYRRLVEKGSGFWAAVTPIPDGVVKAKNVASSLNATPELDEYGFPALDPDLFQGKERDATLEECVSGLKADPFHFSRVEPILKKRSDGNYDISYNEAANVPSPRKNAGSPKESTPSRKPTQKRAPKKSRQDHPEKRPIDFMVKPRGRPRKYPRPGGDVDVDKMDENEIKLLRHSMIMAEKYARRKVEEEIAFRINEGNEAVHVTNEVLAEVEALRQQAGQDPLSRLSRESILHKFAGGPEPAEQLKEPLGGNVKGRPRRPKIPPYLPSMAAHSIFVPAKPNKAPSSSQPTSKPEKIESGSGRTRRRPAHLQDDVLETELEEEIFGPARKKRRRQSSPRAAVVPYLPSVAAHTWPYISVPSSKKTKRVRKPKPKEPVAPPRAPRAIPKHPEPNEAFITPPTLLSEPQPPSPEVPAAPPPTSPTALVAPIPRSLSPPIPLESTGPFVPSSSTGPPINIPRVSSGTGKACKKTTEVTSQDKNGPPTPERSSPASRTPLATPASRASQVRVDPETNVASEGSYPGWIQFMMKYYEGGLKEIPRLSYGAFPGKTQIRRKRPIEPAGFRPRYWKLIVFKSSRLRSLDWFTPSPMPLNAPPSGRKRGKRSGSVLHPDASTNEDLSLLSPSTSQPRLESKQSATVPKLSNQEQHLDPSESLDFRHEQSQVQPETTCKIQAGSDTPVRRGNSKPLLQATCLSIPATEPVSLPPSTLRLDTDSAATYISPYMVTNGSKRKAVHQPGLRPPRSDPFLGRDDLATQHETSPNVTADHTKLLPAGNVSAVLTEKASPTREKIQMTVTEKEICLNIDQAVSLTREHIVSPVPDSSALAREPQTLKSHSTVNVESPAITSLPQDLTDDHAGAPIVPGHPGNVRRLLDTATPPHIIANAPTTYSHDVSVQPMDAPIQEILQGTLDQEVPSHNSETPEINGAATLSTSEDALAVAPKTARAILDLEAPATNEQSHHNDEAAAKSLSMTESAPLSPASHLPDVQQEAARKEDGVHAANLPQNMESFEPSPKRKANAGRKVYGKISRLGGSAAFLRKNIVMDIVQKCDGIFPGDREIIKPFAAEWTRRGQQGSPELPTIQNALSSLCAEGKLRKINFTFQTSEGKLVKKIMLTLPNVKPTNPRVREVQTLMMANHPHFYIPEAVVEDFPRYYKPRIGVYGEEQGQKIIRGKSNLVQARLAALKEQEQKEQEQTRVPDYIRNGDYVDDDDDGDDDDDEGPDESDEDVYIRRVPKVTHEPRPYVKRPKVDKPVRVKPDRPVKVVRPAGRPKKTPSIVPVEPPLPLPAKDSNKEQNGGLLWLATEYAFSNYNFEDERPTLIEPAIAQNTRRQYSRYGSRVKIVEPKTSRNNKAKEEVDALIRRAAQTVWESEQREARQDRDSPLLPGLDTVSDSPPSPYPPVWPSHPPERVTYRDTYAEMGPHTSPVESAPYGSLHVEDTRESEGSGSDEDEDQDQHISKRRRTVAFGDTSCLGSPEVEQVTPSTPDLSGVGAVSFNVSTGKPHKFQPQRRAFLVNFMDPVHIFNQTTGTFATKFSGIKPPRLITKNIGTCTRPYSHGPQIFHPDFPRPRGKIPSFQPNKQGYVVSFMDPVHIFHQTTGTFSTQFSGFNPLKVINKNLGTCTRPYSHGPRLFHRDFPKPRGSRWLFPKRPEYAGETVFEKEVNEALKWELGNEEVQDMQIGGFAFVNHTMKHALITAKDVEAQMHRNKQYVVAPNGRPSSKLLDRDNPVRPRIGTSVFNSGNKEISRAAAEALRRIQVRAPLKSRRLTSLVSKPREPIGRPVPPDTLKRPYSLRRARGPKGARSLGKNGEKRLLTAVMVVRTLTGGLDKRIDWVLVAKAFGESRTQLFIHGKWAQILQKYKLGLPQIETDFEDAFMKAYEEGSIPALDFDDLAAYDWKFLTEWAMALASSHASPSLQPDLPGDRAELEETYAMKDTSEMDVNGYYGINVPSGITLSKRSSIIHRKAYAYPVRVPNEMSAPEAPEQLVLARSWIRANVITPEKGYNPELSRSKLETLPITIVEEGLKELLANRVLAQENKGRLVPGRNYDVSEHFLSSLRINITPVQLQRAQVYKDELDQCFNEAGSAPWVPTAPEGEVLVIMNLLAHQRIKLVPINVPLNKWGHTDGGYESRHIDKSRLNFDMEIRPTPDYVCGNPLDPLPDPPNQHLIDPMARIPLWYDIHGSLVPVMWEMALTAVLALLVIRPGVGAEEIEKAVTPAMEAWEIQILLDWCIVAKVATKVRTGYTTDEWWWLALPPSNNVDEIEELSYDNVTTNVSGGGKGKGKEVDRPEGPEHDDLEFMDLES